MFVKIKKPSNGFTLIELLVVIVIIGLLTGILLVNYNSVRQRGRDAKRKADLQQVASALEIYKADNGGYPLRSVIDGVGVIMGCGANCDAACPWGSTFSCGADSTVYMSKLPEDSLSTLDYYYNSGGTTYTLESCLENKGDQEAVTASYMECTCSGGKGYQVTNP